MRHNTKTIVSLCLAVSLLIPAAQLLAGGQEETVQSGGDPYVEIWMAGNNIVAAEKDHPVSQHYLEAVGYGYYKPLIPWNGGKDYFQRLNLAIASNEMPDLFLPWNGIEYDLAEQGAIAELSELLPEYAPNYWNAVPDEIWNLVRASSPDGESIYYLPAVATAPYGAAFMRADWLERVGKEMPTTIAEYEDVLRAFRDMDANGNGDPNDEIPTSGRENARWMDHLFAPFGVAMYEGNPEWEIYDGKLTYSAVTPNMKAALQWIAKLYEEDLLDQEVFLNNKKQFDAKVKNDRVGSWFHMPRWVGTRLSAAMELNPELEAVWQPVLEAPGFDGYYSTRVFDKPYWVLNAADMDKVIGGLKILNYNLSPEYAAAVAEGWEGVNYIMENGEKKFVDPWDDLNVDKPLQQSSVISKEIYLEQIKARQEDPKLEAMWLQIVKDSQAKSVAGQAVSSTVYNDYPDIASRQLWYEYAAKIIIGAWDISKFDEFVEKWYASGGEEVTRRAREHYAKVEALQ